MLSLIPISDANPTRRFPVVTIGLIALNVIAFLQEPGFGTTSASLAYFYEHAPVPCQLLTGACPALIQDPGLVDFVFSMLFSTFLHGGFLHIAGNMLFLWVFGNNVEDYLGRAKYVGFYLLGGLFASLAHVLWALKDLPAAPPSNQVFLACVQGAAQCAGLSPYVPSVGASGAVAAVMGAYLLLFPHARVNVLIPIFFFFTIVQMSAWLVLVIWFVYQFLIAAQEFAGLAQEVAWMAHVGGFVFGALAILALGGRPHRRQPAWQPGWY